MACNPTSLHFAASSTSINTPKDVKKILIKVEYKGTHYSGWQIQPNAITIQEVLQDVIRRITQSTITIKSSSRTDAGVHAKWQVATFYIPDRISLNKFFNGVNSLLPSDIAVTDLVEVSENFNVRIAAIAKRYIYQVINSPIPRVFESDVSIWKRNQLDLSKASKCIRDFIGTHDFSAFRGKGCQQPNPIKTIRQAGISVTDLDGFTKIQFIFEGSGFLKNMVRIMVGTLLDIDRGKLDANSISKALDSRERGYAGITAPSKGLTLDEIFLDPDPFKLRETKTWQLD